MASESRALTVTPQGTGPGKGSGDIHKSLGHNRVDGVWGIWSGGPGRPGSHHLPESEGDSAGLRLGVPLFRLGFCRL